MDLANVVREGFRMWNRNHILGLPYVLSVLAVGAVFLCMLAATVLSFRLGSFIGVLTAVLMAFAGVAVVLVVPSYFSAAGILMGEKASRGGRPGFSDAIRPPARAVAKLAAINIMIGLAMVILIVPLLVAQVVLKVNLALPLTIAAGCVLMFAPYYAVLTKRGLFESLTLGYSLFRREWTVGLMLVGFTTYVATLVSFAAMPLTLLAAAVFVPLLRLAGIDVLVILIGLFALYFTAVVGVSVAIVAPLNMVWQLGAFRALGGLDEDR